MNKFRKRLLLLGLLFVCSFSFAKIERAGIVVFGIQKEFHKTGDTYIGQSFILEDDSDDELIAEEIDGNGGCDDNIELFVKYTETAAKTPLLFGIESHFSDFFVHIKSKIFKDLYKLFCCWKTFLS